MISQQRSSHTLEHLLNVFVLIVVRNSNDGRMKIYLKVNQILLEATRDEATGDEATGDEEATATSSHPPTRSLESSARSLESTAAESTATAVDSKNI
ncbi:hypothetical protein VNO80_02539 [Phaseolus coccineus]|uniref:Uncharacterized protein n=1 Tax=Phaseolus coccineus TaxID=3886 RepID=A0AAN9RMG7_PHACN